MIIKSIAAEEEDLSIWEKLAPAIADWIKLSSWGGGKEEPRNKWKKG